MKPFHIVLAVAFTTALAGVVAALRGTMSGSSSASSSVPSTPESGTLPAFPRLIAREKLEPGFIRKLLYIIRTTSADGDKLAALIDEESGWNPQARNSIGAAGFLQWVPKYAVGNTGKTSDQIAGETGLQELDDVQTAITRAPGYKTDPAMQGWGSHINAPAETVIATDPDQAYTLNKVYDKAGKGSITVGDVRAAVYGRLAGVKGRVGDGGVLS